MKKYLFGLLFLASLIYSCSKEIECDDAQFCIVNNSNDTIRYGWGTNYYTDTLFPHSKACKNVGYIHISRTSSSYKTIQLSSTKGDYFFDVTDCYYEKVLAE